MTAADWSAVRLTAELAALSTLILLIVGTPLAWGLARTRSRFKPMWAALVTMPLVLPPTVLGYYLLVLIGRRGWLGGWLHDTFGINLIFTWQGAVIAASLVAFPLVLKAARTAFEAVDPQLEQAARVLGLGEWAVFFRVTVPLAWPGILAGTLLVFARSMGEFGATLMVAGSIPGKTQTLSIAVYEAVQAGQDSIANTLVLITSITCIVVLLLAGRLAPSGVRR